MKILLVALLFVSVSVPATAEVTREEERYCKLMAEFAYNTLESRQEGRTYEQAKNSIEDKFWDSNDKFLKDVHEILEEAFGVGEYDYDYYTPEDADDRGGKQAQRQEFRRETFDMCKISHL